MLVHLYGVVPAEASVPGDLLGRRDRPVRYLEDGDLRIVVSDIEEDARVGRQDLLAHAHVLEALADTMTVIPVQFGVIVPDDDTARREFLVSQHDDLTGLLRGFDGLVQLTVHAQHREDQALREVMRRDPDLVELRDAAKRAPAHDQSLQIRLGQVVSQSLEALQQEDGSLVLDRLAPYARAVSVQESRGALDVLDVALLVERARRSELDAAVTVLAEEVSGRVDIRYVGPQPPYAFLEPMRAGELAWA